MNATPLHHVWDYRDVDRAFWTEHLEGFVPETLVDAHAHVALPAHRHAKMTDEMRRQYWVNEVSEPIDAQTLAACDAITYPGRTVRRLVFGWPSLDFDLDAQNDYVSRECTARGWNGLALLDPHWPPDRIAAELHRPGMIGFKPYYALIGPSPETRDAFLEASIFDFLPRAALEAADARGAWITLHVPHADRLGHPQNIAEIKEIRRRYPNILLVIAHLGRSYTRGHAEESLPKLADDDGLYFDISAVLNPEVLRLAIETLGARRLIYGTDNPVFYMRGRRQWHGHSYVNRTSHPFHFNTDRESPEVEASYTLYMYEALKALKDVCEELSLSRGEVQAILGGNAQRLIGAASGEIRSR